MIHPMNWLKGTSAARSLPDKQRRMYTSEQTDNFRLIAKLFAVQSSHTLTFEDLASSNVQRELAEIGQFAEVAHGTVSPEFIWEHMESLMQPQFPLDGYDALRGSELITAFHGTVAELQCYIAYRPPTKQLIIAFSGTSSVSQTFRNIDARLVAYPGGERCAVHAGFWRLYNGVKSRVLSELDKALDKALTQYDIEEIVCTGHSMGAVMCYLFALDIMGVGTAEGSSHPRPPITLPLKLALFGSPRVGNEALAEHWRHVMAERNARGQSVKDYSVRCYNDGVPMIPPQHLGYCHFSKTPLYLAHGHLFHVPSAESEYTSFSIDPSLPKPKDLTLEHPLGGHNYYNSRDMEKLLRNMKWFHAMKSQEVDWASYGDWLRKEREKYEETG